MSRLSRSRLSWALVLTAGVGTRLDPLTRVRAKPAVPVAGEPLVRRIIRGLVAQSVTELVLNLHHLPATIASVVGDGHDLGATVRYSWEQPVVLGSAGGPRHALPLVDASTFLIVNGDTLSAVDLASLAAAHDAEGARVTLALTPNREPHKYGGVRLDTRGSVTGFAPRGPAAEGSFHFVGVQVVEADVFRPLSPGVPRAVITSGPATSLTGEAGVYNELILREPGRVRGFVSETAFWDIGTVADYVATSFALSEGTPAGLTVGSRVTVDPSATVTRSILWDDVEIGPGCRLEGCVVTDRVRVPAGREYREVVLIATRGDIESIPLAGRRAGLAL